MTEQGSNFHPQESADNNQLPNLTLREAQQLLGFTSKRMEYVVSHLRFRTVKQGEDTMVDRQSLLSYIEIRKQRIGLQYSGPDVPKDVGPLISPPGNGRARIVIVK